MLSEADHHRIQAAVDAAEARTGVHIATAIVPASDRYALYPLVWGALLALAAGGAVAFFRPAFGGREIFVLEAVLFILLSLLFDWWPLRVRLVPRHVRHAHASAMAQREFAARILAGGKSGVLLFVSLGERYVEVIADRALHASMGAETWNRIVGKFVAAAASERLVEGVVEVLNTCAEEIAARSGT
jgi:putative membrane protein